MFLMRSAGKTGLRLLVSRHHVITTVGAGAAAADVDVGGGVGDDDDDDHNK